ncbi:uncharacterized protein BYT42DRAFT_113937 [Radiomyces spectabilis]|uniref:uncharacterized protein n=1 Tax=Radiomyces spectabilis TaxID=64574 RepID=UPI00222065A5|nr:uncharacterized protein BYT42DRAFT_113937 [Radiomyces spectabilis]KAI8369537.1 hypothetical protein BYT42DRAFT_113937 [Radiomyces spectabilis]
MAIQQDTTDIAETDQKATAQTVSPSDDIPPSTMTEDEQLSSASSQSHLMEKPRAMADLASSPRKIPGAGHHSPTRPKLDTPIRSADTSRLLTLDKMPHHRPIKQRDLTPTAPTQERQLTVETAVFPDQPMFQKQNISPPSVRMLFCLFAFYPMHCFSFCHLLSFSQTSCNSLVANG